MLEESPRKTIYSILSRPSREISVGSIRLGGSEPIVIQSMCATSTQDIDATLAQIRSLEAAGAQLIRVAIDSTSDVESLKAIRQETNANLVVDLQENYRLAEDVAPLVQKIRYNPGHLCHHEKEVSIEEKVKRIVDVAGNNNCALRIGINCGSLEKSRTDHAHGANIQIALESAMRHCEIVERLGFSRFVVSIKSSDPEIVIDANRQFSQILPHIPIHLGVTEAGLLPDAEIKSRRALEVLLAEGIGDTLRVSLTVKDEFKFKEVEIGRAIVRDVMSGRLTIKARQGQESRLNIISCPSCSRVENSAFVDLAERVREATVFARDVDLTIAVMGCRVNGPGETDHADLGLWCAPNFVNLKRGSDLVGRFAYDEVVEVMLSHLREMVEKLPIKVG